jgi:hypothetical protein
MPRIVELPDRGRLIVGTDLQGNLDDFDRLAHIFAEANKGPDGATLVLTGDLVHGPEIPRQHWPDYLGSYFHADSARLLERAEQLWSAYPGRIHYLLGNHEHAHIGGPVVSKFFANEALRLERLMGPQRSEQVRSWLSGWPLVAIARRAGIIMTHGAPNAVIRSPEDVERARLDPPGGVDGVVDEVVADLLWARTASTPRAHAFMNTFDANLRVALYGHDVAREGYAIDREPLLCVSTSFGCFDGDKLYLEWDLGARAESAAHLAEAGLKPLCPEAAPVYRRTSAPALVQEQTR